MSLVAMTNELAADRVTGSSFGCFDTLEVPARPQISFSKKPVKKVFSQSHEKKKREHVLVRSGIPARLLRVMYGTPQPQARKAGNARCVFSGGWVGRGDAEYEW